MDFFDFDVRHRDFDDDVLVKPADRNIWFQDKCAFSEEPILQSVTVQLAALDVVLERFPADVFIDATNGICKCGFPSVRNRNSFEKYS